MKTLPLAADLIACRAQGHLVARLRDVAERTPPVWQCQHPECPRLAPLLPDGLPAPG